VKKTVLNYERIFKEILKIFFSKNEIARFNNLVFGEKNEHKRVKSKHKDGQQMGFNFNSNASVQVQIDLLITFASEKLASDKFLSLLQNLGQYCITVGELNSAISVYENIIKSTKRDKDLSDIKAEATASLAEIHRRKAEWQYSFKFARQALNIFKRNNNRKGQAHCYNLIGTIYGELGNLKKSQEYFEESLSLSQGSKDSEFKGKIEVNLGIINSVLGNYDKALSYFKRALFTYQEVKNYQRIAEIQHNIGMMRINKDNPGIALKDFDKAIDTCIKIGYLPILGISYLGKSFTFTKQNDYKLAEAFAEKAMQICHRVDDKLSIADIYKVRGIIQRNKKNFEKSENYLRTSMRINKELGNKLNEAETSYELGILYKDLGNISDSKTKFVDALKYYRHLKAQPRVNEIKEQITALSV
jgi:tetratricopeptide (TPR) repeat protein